MTLTQALAIEGAVIGTSAFVLTVRQTWLDRPKVKVSSGVIAPFGQLPRLVVHVENLGRRPIGIREVGFLDHRGREYLARDPWLRSTVASGETDSSQLQLEIPTFVDPGTLLRAFCRTGDMTVIHEKVESDFIQLALEAYAKAQNQ